VQRQRLLLNSLALACVATQAQAQVGPPDPVRPGLTAHDAPAWLRPADTGLLQRPWGRREAGDAYSLGLGWRRLLDDRSWVLGINASYGMAIPDSPRRAGLGLEAIGQYVTLRANYHDGLLRMRPLSAAGRSSYLEKALDGVDYEIEAPVPYVPWLRVSAVGFRWTAATAGYPDLRGDAFMLRGNLSTAWSMEVGRSNDNYNSGRIFARLTWTPGATPGNGISTRLMAEGRSGTSLHPGKLNLHTLDRVR
jgi:hypothetical protein